MIKMNEIFYSIQGESSRVGFPTVFLRTSGCPLRCTYCDTKYAYQEGEMMSIEDIISRVKEFPTKYICVSGGEPLVQKEVFRLLTELCNYDYEVSIETSGHIDCKEVDQRVKKIIDVKTPDSGEPECFHKGNLAFVDKQTEFKFVICSEKDFEWAENFCRENLLFTKSNVLYSPSYKAIPEGWLADQILKTRSTARLQIQLHKILWPNEARGV